MKITKSRLREIIKFTNQSSLKNRSRFIIIDDVEYLNINSSNALLKSLEEPNANVYFFLIFNSETNILGTIKSRCLEYKIDLKIDDTKSIIDNYFNEKIYDHINDSIKNYYSTPKFLISLINYLREKILNGEPFSSVAMDFSDDPGSRASGGSLGYIKRNQMVKEFETKAYTQDLNSLSKPVETSFGYHILETTDKSGEKVKVRHILISPEITEKDESLAYKYALSLRDSSTSLKKFKSLVTKRSEDEQTKKIGGDLGWITPESSPIPEIAEVLGLLEVGECSRPVKSSFGYHLLWLEEVRPGGEPSLDLHWTEIEEIALNHKRMIFFKDWVSEARNNFYISIN